VKLEKVPVDKITQLTPKLRIYINDEWVNYFSEDVKRHGVQDPPHLTRIGEYYSPIDGWHRVQAAKKAGLKEIDAFVYNEGEVDPFISGLRLNMVQQSLDPISLAYAIRELAFNRRMAWKQIEEITGISERHLREFLKLLDLPESEQKKIALGIMPAFGEEAQNKLKRGFRRHGGEQGGFGVRCPVCGRFPEKGVGKWIYFCPEHEDAYSETLGWIMSGEWKRRT
jgi:ParB/RepB/Spo0J family partition protein